MAFFRMEDLPEKQVPPTSYHILSAEPITVLHITVPPNSCLPEHAHPHFQMGYVLSGSAWFTIGSETQKLTPGMVYVIPPDTPHICKTEDEPLVLLDIYHPPKLDRL